MVIRVWMLDLRKGVSGFLTAALLTVRLYYTGKKVAPAEDAPPAEAPETKAKKAAGGRAGGEHAGTVSADLLQCQMVYVRVPSRQNSDIWLYRQGWYVLRHVSRHSYASVCHHAGKAKAKDTGKKAPAAEEVDDIPVEDAGEGQTAAEREEAEQEEAGVHPATAILHL